MPRAITCMLNLSEISVERALSLRDDPARNRSVRIDFRCVECSQPVRPHKDGKSGAAHIEHLERNPDCRLSDPSRI
jgi:hypothetical protein